MGTQETLARQIHYHLFTLHVIHFIVEFQNTSSCALQWVNGVSEPKYGLKTGDNNSKVTAQKRVNQFQSMGHRIEFPRDDLNEYKSNFSG